MQIASLEIIETLHGQVVNALSLAQTFHCMVELHAFATADGNLVIPSITRPQTHASLTSLQDLAAEREQLEKKCGKQLVNLALYFHSHSGDVQPSLGDFLSGVNLSMLLQHYGYELGFGETFIPPRFCTANQQGHLFTYHFTQTVGGLQKLRELVQQRMQYLAEEAGLPDPLTAEANEIFEEDFIQDRQWYMRHAEHEFWMRWDRNIGVSVLSFGYALFPFDLVGEAIVL